MMPATVQLDGDPIGYPVDGTMKNTTCDQIAAVGANGLVRGVSTTVGAGFSLAFIGKAGERIEFKYWNDAQQREYHVKLRYTMVVNGQLGSFDPDLGPQELALSVVPFCYPCESGCSHYFFQEVAMVEAPRECVDNGGTCEFEASSGGNWSCHTGGDTSSPECYTPCAVHPPLAPPPPAPPILPPPPLMPPSRCNAHFVNSDELGNFPDSATMVPAIVTLGGDKIGYPADGTIAADPRS